MAVTLEQVQLLSRENDLGADVFFHALGSFRRWARLWLSISFKKLPGCPCKFWTGTQVQSFLGRSLHKSYLIIKHALYFTWDAIMRVRPEGEVHYFEPSMVDHRAVLVLDSLIWIVSHLSRSLPALPLWVFLTLPLCMLSCVVPSWYIDITTAFPQVPVRNFYHYPLTQLSQMPSETTQ